MKFYHNIFSPSLNPKTKEEDRKKNYHKKTNKLLFSCNVNTFLLQLLLYQNDI